MTPILLTEVEGMLPNSFSEASITQIPTHICTCAHTHTHTHTLTQDRDNTREDYRPISSTKC
jgi:hypothetical protein